VVRVENLHAVGVSVPRFDVAAGETVVLAGANGTGKTTLLLALAGLLRPEAGRVEVAGTDIYALAPAARDRFRARTVAMIFQAGNLLPAFTVLENVILPLKFAGVGGAEARRRADSALDRAGLAGLGRRRPETLSGGERQRAAIARAIALDAPVVLADEPTAFLDPRARDEVVGLLRAVLGGRTAVVVAHDADVGVLGRSVRMEEIRG
jgi:putative ABC transport system ATP-binding protein